MNNNFFEVLRPGINTTYQDEGRFHMQHLGVAPSGCMDKKSYLIANKIVSNQNQEGVLEFAYQGPLLKLEKGKTKFTITGNVIFQIIKSNNDIINGSSIDFMLTISNNDFYQESDFSVIIGYATVNDPLGPDAYGYYIYDSEDYGYGLMPSYDWIEIASNGVGTNLDFQDGTGEYYSAQDYSASFSFAKKFVNWFGFGTSIKYINSQIWHSHSSAFAMDLGAQIYSDFFSSKDGEHDGVKIGMSISNYGTRMKYDGLDLIQPIDPSDDYGNYGDVMGKYETSSWELPLIFRLGLFFGRK